MVTGELSDDGTMDTVIECTCSKCGKVWESRFNFDGGESEDDFDAAGRYDDFVDWCLEEVENDLCDCEQLKAKA